MFQKVFFILLLSVRSASQSLADVQADCNEDVSLDCQCLDTDNRNFISVAWYKVDNQGGKKGIFRRNINENTGKNYTFHRNIIFEKNYSMSVLGVMPNDSGTYECIINADVGGKNLHSTVNLMVHACLTPLDPTTVTNVLNATQQPDRIKDLPLKWSITGYVAVGLVKIILSLISIWAIQAFSGRYPRRYQ